MNDFYEGDKNITKKLSVELKRSDWELLILHFLGLDHIGHVEGPFSSKIPTKLKEMDTVAMHIHLALLHMVKCHKLFRNLFDILIIFRLFRDNPMKSCRHCSLLPEIMVSIQIKVQPLFCRGHFDVNVSHVQCSLVQVHLPGNFNS